MAEKPLNPKDWLCLNCYHDSMCRYGQILLCDRCGGQQAILKATIDRATDLDKVENGLKKAIKQIEGMAAWLKDDQPMITKGAKDLIEKELQPIIDALA